MEIKIGEIIKQKRRERGESQETLAEAFGVSVQAVSKWETDMSYPDLTLLPRIAEYFGITLDGLFFGKTECTGSLDDFPIDRKLRVVQIYNGKVLSNEEYDADKPIKLIMPDDAYPTANGVPYPGVPYPVINVEISGNASIDGNISGYVEAGGNIACADVGAHAEAGGSVACKNVGAHAQAGGSIACHGVGSHVQAGADIICGDIGGMATAGCDIKCVNVACDANAGCDIHCADIYGNANAGCDIHCSNIQGDASAETITYKN